MWKQIFIIISANYTRITSHFYKEGLIWFNSGKSLEDATEVVDFLGEQKELKDILYFQRGYQEGLIQKGMEDGYNERNLFEIEHKYIENRYKDKTKDAIKGLVT